MLKELYGLENEPTAEDITRIADGQVRVLIQTQAALTGIATFLTSMSVIAGIAPGMLPDDIDPVMGNVGLLLDNLGKNIQVLQTNALAIGQQVEEVRNRLSKPLETCPCREDGGGCTCWADSETKPVLHLLQD